MDTDTQDFPTRFTDSLTSAPGLELALLRPLLTLLAAGEPVTVDQLAAETGRTREEIRQALAAMPDTEYDTQGRVTGYGLTLNPTPHRYETDGRTLYTWCALDTLVFPAVLGHTAQVTSPCRATGEPVRLTVPPDGPTSVEPAGAVVSLVACETPASIRTSFCNEIHFFTSAAAAEDWLAGHPGSRVLPVADAYAIEQPLIHQILTGTSPSGCC
ncbi:alkylmercury (organomercurial) lyase MerB [Streptomyces sp. NBRC 14336]|uniref:organomercurial lyase MerB n=1 Tax=Streptomyces TaxID=1883 RepID=UPI000C6CD45A|nr:MULTISPECIES: organomercurial lyase MerB [Streptomyces]GLW47602.1 alkylmercury (organomercurial) lyase MerB [Streptomyces sp. NBRC 14336]